MVLNSEFLLFYGGILVALVLLATVGVTLSRLVERGGRTRAVAGRLAIVLLVGESLAWGYYSLVLRGWAPLPEALFTPVTWVVNHVSWFGGAQMVLAAAFGLGSFLTRERPNEAQFEILSPAGRRLRRSDARRQWMYGTVFLVAALITLTSVLYHKLYASRPPELTPAEPARAIDGRIVIPTGGFGAGEFHRYSFDAGEGRRIRFFVFRDENGTPRAAYDACQMCGNKGYLKQGKDLICFACGAAIYAPTVGRKGGCNPIPLVYSVSKETLTVTVDALLGGEGADLFPLAEAGAK